MSIYQITDCTTSFRTPYKYTNTSSGNYYLIFRVSFFFLLDILLKQAVIECVFKRLYYIIAYLFLYAQIHLVGIIRRQVGGRV